MQEYSDIFCTKVISPSIYKRKKMLTVDDITMYLHKIISIYLRAQDGFHNIKFFSMEHSYMDSTKEERRIRKIEGEVSNQL